MSLNVGDILNSRYRILEIIAQGGMGAIYHAVDERLNVSVAVKENLYTTEEAIRQFHREATILAGLGIGADFAKTCSSRSTEKA